MIVHPRPVVRKPVFCTQRQGCLSVLVDGVLFMAELMQHDRIGQRDRLTKGVGVFLSQSQGLVAPGERLIRIAQMPQGMGHHGTGEDTKIHAKVRDMRAVLLAVVAGQTVVPVVTGRGKLSQVVQAPCQCEVCLQEEGGILDMLRRAEELGPHLSCQLLLCLHDITGPQPPLHGKQL